MSTKMVITEQRPSRSVCSEHYYTCKYYGKAVNFTVTRWLEEFCIDPYVSRLEIPALNIGVSLQADSPVEYHDEWQFNDISEMCMHFITRLLAMHGEFADKKLAVLS